MHIASDDFVNKRTDLFKRDKDNNRLPAPIFFIISSYYRVGRNKK